MKTLFVRKINRVMLPVDAINMELIEDIKDGDYMIQLTKPRDIVRHRRFFALLNFAFKNWDVEESHKDFEAFREKVTIMAGYYREVWDLEGNLELKAKSISFAKMDEVDFQVLYSRVVDVILQRVLRNYSKDDLEEVVLQVLRFT